jgi:hypothetical protein
MGVFPMGIELANDVAVERPQQAALIRTLNEVQEFQPSTRRRLFGFVPNSRLGGH